MNTTTLVIIAALAYVYYVDSKKKAATDVATTLAGAAEDFAQILGMSYALTVKTVQDSGNLGTITGQSTPTGPPAPPSVTPIATPPKDFSANQSDQ